MSEAPAPFTPPPLDLDRVAAAARAGDQAALKQAYREVFGSRLGQMVLLSILQDCGTGDHRGPDMAALARAYHDGRSDAALMIMTRAGYDSAARAAAVLTDSLNEGNRDHGQRSRSDSRPFLPGDPDGGEPEF